MWNPKGALGLVLLSWAGVAVGAGAEAHAQSMSQVAAGQTSCSTAGGEGLSQQLVEVQRCLHPGQFVSFANADITATSGRVHLVAQASARDALQAAASVVPLQINSGFRPLSDQYLLWGSGQCSVVATPGSSNHQSGRAVDVNNTVAARTALQNAGCVWLGPSDAVHYDCPGADLRADSVRSFQRLWNINNPSMLLAEDGAWGPMTLAAMQASPASGFALGGLDTCGPCAGGAELNACGACGAPPMEVCDTVDNDCDGDTDEGLLNLCGTCGAAPVEVCDLADNDCDGDIDEGCPGTTLDAGVGDDAGADADQGAEADAGVGTDAMTPFGDGGGVGVDLGPSGGASSGCVVGPGGSPGRAAPWIALGMLGLLARRRRK